MNSPVSSNAERHIHGKSNIEKVDLLAQMLDSKLQNELLTATQEPGLHKFTSNLRDEDHAGVEAGIGVNVQKSARMRKSERPGKMKELKCCCVAVFR